MTLIEGISLVLGIVSIVLAIIAIIAAKNSEKEVRENFQKTQDFMNNNYEKTKDFMNSNYEKTKEVLAEIEKKSAIIENTVSSSQKQLMDTMTNIINQTVLPTKSEPGEEMGMIFMKQMMDSDDPAKFMESLKPLIEMSKSSEPH